MFIDGSWGSASPLPRFAVCNPAGGATVNERPDAGAAAPFGGLKDSGLGREGGPGRERSQEGIAESFETKLGGFAI